MGWTLVSAAASGAPSESLPQIKKFFVFGMLPLVYTGIRSSHMCRRATESWFVVVLVAGVLALLQFGGSAMQAAVRGGDFYAAYVDDRITGFYSHWMTFSQASVLVLVTLACYLCFGRRRPGFGIWLAVGGAIGAALLLSFTRSAWLALLACGLYLLAVKRPRALALVPIVLAIGYLAAPAALQQRVRSIRPEANQSRIVMWRTGLNMIRAHPVLGVGPERAGPLFSEFQPRDVEELPPGFYGHLHNVYIHYAAERGIPAALIVLWLFARILFDMRRGLRSLPDGRDDRRFPRPRGYRGYPGDRGAQRLRCLAWRQRDPRCLSGLGRRSLSGHSGTSALNGTKLGIEVRFPSACEQLSIHSERSRKYCKHGSFRS